MNITDLQNDILTKIFSFMPDRDVKAFGLTSKKTNVIAQKEIQRRNDALESLLTAYKVTQTFNINSPKEADIFLLGEVHFHEGCDQAQGDLINYWAQRGPVIVMVEVTPNNVKIAPLLDENEKQKFLSESKISNNKNIHILGWDNASEDPELQDINKKFEECNNVENQIKYNNNKEKIELLINEFDENELDDFNQLVGGYTQQVNELLNMSQKVLEAYEIHLDMQQYLKKVRDFNYSFQPFVERIDDEFPERTASMVNTIANISTFISQNSLRHPKIILIAGNKHLREKAENNDPRYGLSPLYNELEKHKAVIAIHAQACEDLELEKQSLRKD